MLSIRLVYNYVYNDKQVKLYSTFLLTYISLITYMKMFNYCWLHGTTFPLKTITGSHHFWLDKKSSHLYVHVIIYYKFQLQLQKGLIKSRADIGGGGA